MSAAYGRAIAAIDTADDRNGVSPSCNQIDSCQRHLLASDARSRHAHLARSHEFVQ